MGLRPLNRRFAMVKSRVRDLGLVKVVLWLYRPEVLTSSVDPQF